MAVLSVCVCVCVCVRARVYAHKRAYTDKLHIQRWRPNGWTDRDPNWYKHSLGQSAQVMVVGARAARNRGAAAVPRKREAGERARSARVHGWNMAAHPPRARSASVWRACSRWRIASSVEQKKMCGISDKQFAVACGARLWKTGMLKNGHFIGKC
jgi:hypothetical protein